MALENSRTMIGALAKIRVLQLVGEDERGFTIRGMRTTETCQDLSPVPVVHTSDCHLGTLALRRLSQYCREFHLWFVGPASDGQAVMPGS